MSAVVTEALSPAEHSPASLVQSEHVLPVLIVPVFVKPVQYVTEPPNSVLRFEYSTNPPLPKNWPQLLATIVPAGFPMRTLAVAENTAPNGHTLAWLYTAPVSLWYATNMNVAEQLSACDVAIPEQYAELDARLPICDAVSRTESAKRTIDGSLCVGL